MLRGGVDGLVECRPALFIGGASAVLPNMMI